MKYLGEDFAKALYGALNQRFADSPQTTLAIKGAGVHWDCTAQRGENGCKIHCFDSRGPEYLISFMRDSHQIAWGRTSSKDDIVEAIDLWLQRYQLADLTACLPFVDHAKRRLIDIEEDVNKRFPGMNEVASELHHSLCDCYDLRFQQGVRACAISFYGKNEFPDAVFSWDGCELFRFRADNPQNLATVINAWLGDQMMPSQMRVEFSYLSLGQLADFYENGNPIEGEFLQSWDSIEEFYADMKFDCGPLVRQFVAQMRGKGYDKFLRAGQSMWTLMLSRSRRHGLQLNQAVLSFDFGRDSMDVRSNINGEQLFICPIEITPKIEELLQTLKTRAID